MDFKEKGGEPMKRICFIVMLVLMSTSVLAAEPESPRAMAENFLALLQKGNIGTAYDQLFKGSTIAVDRPQVVTQLMQQTQSGLASYGKVLGYEIVHEEQLSSSVVRLVYFLKSEKAPTTWEFYFYKPKSAWFIANVTFNDQFQFLDKKS
jgi:hypothetical protein